jgi:hypothetical protein
MNFEFLGKFLDRAMRTLYMAEAETFNEIFGDGGPHLWRKFCDKYEQREGDFICSLDNGNLTWLAKRVLKDMAEDAELLKRER